ncbi:MAG: NDMA-dependent alcohol dehydrogenase [Acidimicrobiales bacterium]|nr:NDMA-dependent alcohol dehydrogenase [Acidimicrobiales bacterium]
MASMTTRAAVLHQAGQWWEIEELDLDEPKEHEVLVRFMASGLCHSDEHNREQGNVRLPIVGGHEGAGVVEAVGQGVTRCKVGDHIVTSYIPACGHCRYCSTGRQNLCDAGKYAMVGCLQDETYRFHRGGEDYGGLCALGTFSQRAVVHEYSCVPIDDDIPFEVAALVGCGVTTGWSSSVYAAGVQAGDTVAIFGIGGVGSSAVQGARYAGAKNIVAIDPVPFKLDMARKLGATFATADVEEARQEIVQLTRGQLADEAVVTVGTLEPEIVSDAISLVGKAGTVVLISIGRADVHTLDQSASRVIGYNKRIQGALAGEANPLYDMPRLLGLYKSGQLLLDEIITQRYRLEDINDGYRDLLDGKNIRGVIIHEH